MKELIKPFLEIFNSQDLLDEKERKISSLLANNIWPILDMNSKTVQLITASLLSETEMAWQSNNINNATMTLIKQRIDQLYTLLDLFHVRLKKIDVITPRENELYQSLPTYIEQTLLAFKNIAEILAKGHNVTIDVLLTRWIDSDGNTLLHHACREGREDIIEYLLDLDNIKMILDEKNNSGESPFLLAKRIALNYGGSGLVLRLWEKGVEEKCSFQIDKGKDNRVDLYVAVWQRIKGDYASIIDYYQKFFKKMSEFMRELPEDYKLSHIFIDQLKIILENKERSDKLFLSKNYSTLKDHPLYLINHVFLRDPRYITQSAFLSLCQQGYADGFSYLRAYFLNLHAKQVLSEEEAHLITDYNKIFNEKFNNENCHRYKIINLHITNSNTLETRKINTGEHKGASYVYLTEDRTGVTPAHLACNGETPLVFLRHEVQENPQCLHYRDSAGWTPFHAACAYSPLAVIEYLVEQGAIMALLSNPRQAEADSILLANAIKTNPYHLSDAFYQSLNSRYASDVAQTIQAVNDSLSAKNYTNTVKAYNKLVVLDTGWHYFNDSALDNLAKHQKLIIDSLINIKDKQTLTTLIQLLKEDIALRKQTISRVAMDMIAQFQAIITVTDDREKVQIVHDILLLLRDYKATEMPYDSEKNHLTQLINLLLNQLGLLTNANIYSIEQLVQGWPVSQPLLQQRSLEEICQGLQGLLNKKHNQISLSLSSIKSLLDNPPKLPQNPLHLILTYGSTEHLTTFYKKIPMHALKQLSDNGAFFETQRPGRISNSNFNKCKARYAQETALWDLHDFVLNSTPNDCSIFLAMMSTLYNAARYPTEEQLSTLNYLNKIINSYLNPLQKYAIPLIHSSSDFSRNITIKAKQESKTMIDSVSSSLRSMASIISNNIIPAETFNGLFEKIYNLPQDRLIARLEEYATYLQQLIPHYESANQIIPTNLKIIIDTLCPSIPQNIPSAAYNCSGSNCL